MDLAGYKPTLGEVAALFGKSSRWISDLRAKGEMPADGATLGEFIGAFGSLAAAGSGGLKGKPIDIAKARSAAAKADQDEIKTAALKGAFLPRDGVVDAVQGAFARVRAKLLALPSKCAPAISAMKSPVAIQEKLTELVHEALAELAGTIVGGQPLSDDDLAPGDEPGDRGDGQNVVAGVCTTAAADGEPVGGQAPKAKPRGKRGARAVGHQPG
jgi:hypothetical protein